MPINWKKGRGKLGMFAPVLGNWISESEAHGHQLRCTRSISKTLGESHIELRARWIIGPEKYYDEVALFGVNREGQVCFWSFTSDGKQSQGELIDVTDLHPHAFGFLAEMPAGMARMAYFPHPDEGFIWVVESKTKKGWNRMVEHHYTVAT